MYYKNIALFYTLIALIYSPLAATAQEENTCRATDNICMTTHLISLAKSIEKDSWRDKTYREIAKTMAADGRAIEAIPLIEKIINPDTKALTIRAIGMEAAMANKIPDALFAKLHAEATKITDPPSFGIALTYIAMAQAYAGDDAGALETAKSMTNDSLRHKAYGETAEIQAEQNKFQQALHSVSMIESQSYKNKAYKNVSRIFSTSKQYQHAYDSALNIINPVMQAEAIQFILDTQRHSLEKEKKQSD